MREGIGEESIPTVITHIESFKGEVLDHELLRDQL
jgi:hypothetical protein